MVSILSPMTIQFFFLFTPFFVLSIFLTVTSGMEVHEKLILVFKTVTSIEIICIILIFGGNSIFSLFSITVDAFRIGAGAILFLSAVDQVRGNTTRTEVIDNSDISVVPLSIPIVVGPSTIGTLLVMGARLKTIHDYLVGVLAVTMAVILLGLILLAAPWLQKILKQKGISILSRLSGLILSALSAQMVFTGIKNFLY